MSICEGQVEEILALLRLAYSSNTPEKCRLEAYKEVITELEKMVEFNNLQPSISNIIIKEIHNTYTDLSRASTRRLTSIVNRKK